MNWVLSQYRLAFISDLRILGTHFGSSSIVLFAPRSTLLLTGLDLWGVISRTLLLGLAIYGSLSLYTFYTIGLLPLIYFNYFYLFLNKYESKLISLFNYHFLLLDPTGSPDIDTDDPRLTLN